MFVFTHKVKNIDTKFGIKALSADCLVLNRHLSATHNKTVGPLSRIRSAQAEKKAKKKKGELDELVIEWFVPKHFDKCNNSKRDNLCHIDLR